MKSNCTIICKIMSVILMITICVFLFSGCSNKTDAMDYVSVKFSGYNGNGKADLNVDFSAMIEAIIGDEPAGDSYEEFSKWMNEYLLYDEGIEVSFAPRDGLSNGDTITVKVSLSETAAKKVTGGEQKFTVSGLPEIETVDMFKDVSLRYEGIVGDFTMIHLDKLSGSQILQDCNFDVDPQGNVKNGDVITVTITNTDTLAEKHLCTPAEISKTFIVSGLDEYLTDSDLLPDDKIRDIIAHYIPTCQKEDDFLFTYTDSVYYKTYFCVGKEDRFGTDFNRLEVFACYDEYMDGEYRWTVYTPLTFRNMILSAEGTVDLEYEDGYNAVFYTDPDELLKKLEADYIVEEVYIEY